MSISDGNLEFNYPAWQPRGFAGYKKKKVFSQRIFMKSGFYPGVAEAGLPAFEEGGESN